MGHCIEHWKPVLLFLVLFCSIPFRLSYTDLTSFITHLKYMPVVTINLFSLLTQRLVEWSSGSSSFVRMGCFKCSAGDKHCYKNARNEQTQCSHLSVMQSFYSTMMMILCLILLKVLCLLLPPSPGSELFEEPSGYNLQFQ